MSNDKQIDYLKTNKNSWNQKVEFHVNSEFYDMKNFMNGQTSLNEIELNLLGDLTGKKILHLQCHFGQDSISMSRMGAEVTGIDLSNEAVKKGEELAAELGANTKFICSDVYDLPNHLDEKFDIVYTSYGTIGWLPDLGKWANVISHFLKPGGRFVFVEFHPVVWMYDDDFDIIKYRYFNSGPISESEEGTYADRDVKIELDYVMWNHSISEVLNNLISEKLEITKFDEYDYSPYDCFNGTEKIAHRKYRIEKFGDKIPMVYALIAEASA